MAIKIVENIPLAPLTTFQIGGSAKYFTEAGTEDEIQEAVVWAKQHQMDIVILAGGSNVLIPDEGLSGLVIHITGDDFSYSGTALDCNAGCNLLKVITGMADRGLGGWEKLAGIPGSMGGGVRGGIGAFGTEIKDFVTNVRALDTSTNTIKEFSNTKCEFSYRTSFFKTDPKWIITRAHIALKRVDSAESHTIIKETIAAREKKHLQSARTAGSFFMNPSAPRNICKMFEKEKGVASREGRVPAGWLIEKADMKGVSIGGAQMSKQHSNYVINTGNATAHDVRLLTGQVKKAVKKKFNIDLKEEVRIISL